MSTRWISGLSFAALLVLGVPPARAQVLTQDQIEIRIMAIDIEVRDLEEVARKIRGENFRLVIGGTGEGSVILVSPEQVESLFVSALLNGTMKVEQAAKFAQMFGVMTRTYLTEIDAEIRRLREGRERLVRALTGAGIQPPTSWETPVPTTLQGTASGKWSSACSWNDPEMDKFTDGGTFTITFDGRGGVSGSYISSSSAYGVEGAIAASGTANGTGSGSGWSLNWSGRFDQPREGGIVGSGGLQVTISDFGGGSCTGTWAVP
ncbi:MAG: hypothetical protein ABR559_04760 [Gemmatimonadota bacterium]